MKFEKVNISIYKPIKIDYARDQLIGQFEGDKCICNGVKLKFYKNNIEIKEYSTQNFATWSYRKHKRWKKNGLGNCHDSFHLEYYIFKKIYKDYHCWYDNIEIKNYEDIDTFDKFNNIKYYRFKVVPLVCMYTHDYYPDLFIKNYFHHPMKEVCTTDTKYMIEYLNKYLSSNILDESSYWREWKANSIEKWIENKEAADKDVKEGSLFVVDWVEEEE